MTYLVDALFIVVGLLIGILLNILADDLPHRLNPYRPHCHECGRAYHPNQWLAVWAFITGRTHCAQCQARLRLRKPIVEIVSAITLVFLYNRFDLTPKFWLLAILMECFLLITVIDLEHRLILFVTVIPTAIVALLYTLFANGEPFIGALIKALVGGAVGFGVFYLFYLLGFAYSAWVKRRSGQPLDEIAFGGGDVNLAGAVGLAVGWPGIILTIFYTVLAGGLISGLFLLVMYLRRRNGLMEVLPYGPFIVLGAVIVLVFAAELKKLYGATP